MKNRLKREWNHECLRGLISIWSNLPSARKSSARKSSTSIGHLDAIQVRMSRHNFSVGASIGLSASCVKMRPSSKNWSAICLIGGDEGNSYSICATSILFLLSTRLPYLFLADCSLNLFLTSPTYVGTWEEEGRIMYRNDVILKILGRSLTAWFPPTIGLEAVIP